MCNLLHFSTTSEEDFSALPRDNYIIERPSEWDGEHIALLAHPHKWYVGDRKGECSCGFRHFGRFLLTDGALIGDSDATFATPEEDPDANDGNEQTTDTCALYDLFLRILVEGHNVDVLDSWSGQDLHAVRTLEVSLSEVGRDRFRFFESCRFELRS